MTHTWQGTGGKHPLPPSARTLWWGPRAQTFLPTKENEELGVNLDRSRKPNKTRRNTLALAGAPVVAGVSIATTNGNVNGG